MSRRSLLVRLFLVLTLGAVPAPAWAQVLFSGEAQARASQFRPYQRNVFEGTKPVVTMVPEVFADDAAQVGEMGYLNAMAVANPFGGWAYTDAILSGINVPSGQSFFRTRIWFQDDKALRALIPKGQTRLDILVQFRVQVVTVAPQKPGIFEQATPGVTAALSVSSLVTRTASGGHTVVNGPYEHYLRQSGFLTGLPEPGGELIVPVLATISPFQANGLEVRLNNRVAASNLSQRHFASSFIALALADYPDMVTLLDGTPIGDFGVVYWALPLVEKQP